MIPESETASHDALATIYGHDDKIDLTLECAKAVLAINPSESEFQQPVRSMGGQ